MATPSLYTTTQLRDLVSIVPQINSFYASLFPANPDISASDEIIFDVQKHKHKIAPLVRVYGKNKELLRDAYTTSRIVPPKLGGKRSISPETIAGRIAGEQIVHGGFTPAQRAKLLLMKDIQDIKNAMNNRLELMCRDVLFTGAVTSISNFDDETLNVDYGLSASHNITLAGAAKWDQSTSDAQSDLLDARDLIAKDAGLTATMAIVGTAVWKKMRNNDGLMKQFDRYDAKLGTIAPQIQSPDMTYLGRFADSGIDLYLNTGWTVNPTTGIAEPLTPIDKVLVLPRELGQCLSLEYGAITQLEKMGDQANFVTFQEQFVPKLFIEDETDVMSLQVASRALPVMKIVDSVVVIKAV